jgi:predicted small lipoprotein YifL
MTDRAFTRSLRAVLLPLLVAGTLAGCGHGPITVPPDAQVVHLAVSGDSVRLEPSTATAGDIYFVVDTPGAEVIQVQRKTMAEETEGPMSDEDLARLARGDTEGMSITCCLGTGEPYGNVHKVVLSPGKYAFLARQPETPGPMAVLEVLP